VKQERSPIRSSDQWIDLFVTSMQFKGEWLAANDKKVAPLPSSARMDHMLAKRLCGAAQHSGQKTVGVVHLGIEHRDDAPLWAPADTVRLLEQISHLDAPLLAFTPDESGALLFTDRGYSLISGDDQFLRHAVPEGMNQVSISFKRYARRLKAPYPEALKIAENFAIGQAAWRSASEVQAGAATAEQLSLMESLRSGAISATDFAQAWLSARRLALTQHERLREPLERLLDRVFYALEDYSIDPEMREEGDISDEDLRAIVISTLREVEQL
jgi:hypothetical protein